MNNFYLHTQLTDEQMDTLMLYGPGALLGCADCPPPIKISINGEVIEPNHDHFIY